MAARPEAEQQAGSSGVGLMMRGRRTMRGLHIRLMILVVASILPLITFSAMREYLDYRSEQAAIYDGLIAFARGTAVAVERDLQLRIAAMQVLATSPALEADDLAAFDARATAFLAHQPAGTLLDLVKQDRTLLRSYGPPSGVKPPPDQPGRIVVDPGVFTTGQPVVTDLDDGGSAGASRFSVAVPVYRQGAVAYALFLRIPPVGMQDLINRQRLPPDMVVAVVDGQGVVVARVPHGERYLGSPIVPALRDTIRTRNEGVIHAPTLEGASAVAAFARVAPFGWSVTVGAPLDVLFAPIISGVERLAAAAAVVLGIGFAMAIFAARGIVRPIGRLRQLAEHDDQLGSTETAATGLPEADTVARALVSAAAERRDVARRLEESETRFRALFEHSPTGMILIDPDTAMISDCNATAASIVGLTPDEMRGRSILEFTLQTTPERARAVLRDVAGGQRVHYETRIPGHNGPADVVIAAAPLVVGGRTLVLLNQTEVTELRRAEAVLRRNEERLELAREGANLGIWDWNIADGTLTWSEHNWRLHGLEPRAGAAPTNVWRLAVDPADLPRVEADLIAALRSPEHPFASEYNVITPDGSTRRLLGRGQVMRDAAGRAIRMVGINMDVTPRYQAEQARDSLIEMLEGERSRLAEIVESLPIAVGIVDRQGRIVLGNSLMSRLTGPTIPSFDSERAGEWISYYPDGSLVQTDDYPIHTALTRGETVLPGMEFLYRPADGTESWMRVGSLPLRDEAGDVREALAIIQDINAEKHLRDIQNEITARLEQRVREEMSAREAAQQRAAHAERMHALGQIAGGIAHDFNNVLQAVTGGAALIERHPDDSARVLRNARMVLDASKRGAAITSRLLAFSRRGDLRAEAIDPAGLLNDLAEVLTHTLGGSVVCRVDVPSGLPPMFADRGQLETVIVNLATNARDAMPNGGTLTFSADAELVSAGLPHPGGLAAGGYLRLVVADTGSGMDASVLARVTEPFFTTKEPGKGTGLGLAMAKGFAEQSGGSLSIDSVVGKGTRVILWLPVADSRNLANIAEHAGGPEQPDRSRVLLVDDDAIVREILAFSLEDAGYAVVSAESGEAALERLAAGERVDIMVSDLTMPGMDGLTLIRMAREHRADLPTVLLTGFAGDGAALAIGGAISGAFSLLRKPVTGMQLVDRINALLEASRQSVRA